MTEKEALKIILAKVAELDADISAMVGRKFTRIARDKLSHRLVGITKAAEAGLKA